MTTTPHRKRRRWRRRIGWPLTGLGVLLFGYGYLGATTGLVSLPFDRHPIASQLGGAVLAVVGLRWALSESP